jgi:hypothetical protein
MATYTFTLTLQGDGETEDDAWQDAVEAFIADPGVPDGCDVVVVDASLMPCDACGDEQPEDDVLIVEDRVYCQTCIDTLGIGLDDEEAEE